jgi:predicted nucleic acid-binding protein
MTAKVFVDTNVLVYSRDSTEVEKQRQAMEWLASLWRGRNGRLSFQVLQEYYVTVTEKLEPGLDAAAARADVRSLLAWGPLPVDARTVETAWAIQDRYSLSWWDALIVSAAQVADCRLLLSEDLQDGQEFGGLRVVNPFRTSPSSLTA